MGHIFGPHIINHSHVFLLLAEESYGASIKYIYFEGEIWYSWTDNKKQMKKSSNTRMFAQAEISLGMGIWTPIPVKLICCAWMLWNVGKLWRSGTKSYGCFDLFFSCLEHFHFVTETCIQVCLNTYWMI